MAPNYILETCLVTGLYWQAGPMVTAKGTNSLGFIIAGTGNGGSGAAQRALHDGSEPRCPAVPDQRSEPPLGCRAVLPEGREGSNGHAPGRDGDLGGRISL